MSKKKIKVVSILLIFFAMIVFLFDCFTNVATMKLQKSKIQFLSINNSGKNCTIDSLLRDSSGIFLKFEYEPSFQKNYYFFNNLSTYTTFEKIRISEINIFLENFNRERKYVTNYFKNYIDKKLFESYIVQECQNMYLLKEKENEYTDEIFQNFIENVLTVINKETNTRLVFEFCKKKGFDLPNKENFEFAIEGSSIHFDNEGIYCPISSKYHIPIESYIGDVSFFLELYNNDYLENSYEDFYPGIFLTFRFPKNIMLSKYKKIVSEIKLLDGKIIYSSKNI